jgi:hypothetical protein
MLWKIDAARLNPRISSPSTYVRLGRFHPRQ